MEVIILSGADADLDEIYAVHESIPEAGERFLRAVDLKLDLLRNFPRIAPRVYASKVRKTKIGRTPYGLFYTI